MRGIGAGLVMFLLAGCAAVHHRKVGGGDVIALKKQGLSDEEILKEVRSPEVMLTLTDDNVIALVSEGFSEEMINALLALARDVDSGRHHRD